MGCRSQVVAWGRRDGERERGREECWWCGAVGDSLGVTLSLGKEDVEEDREGMWLEAPACPLCQKDVRRRESHRGGPGLSAGYGGEMHGFLGVLGGGGGEEKMGRM